MPFPIETPKYFLYIWKYKNAEVESTIYAYNLD